MKRCFVGWHAWSTWGVGMTVDAEWFSPTAAQQNGMRAAILQGRTERQATGARFDISDGVVRFHQGQARVCLVCGKRQRRLFWPSPEMRKASEESFGGWAVLTYRDAVSQGVFSGPPPAGVDHARIGDLVLPGLRAVSWPEPSRSSLGCRFGLLHIALRNQHQQICPSCRLFFWLD